MANVLKTIRSGEDYIESLRGRDLKVYLFGELVKEPVDHPMIRPSINAVAETYDLAMREEALASADSSITGLKVNRFLHIAESAEDLVPTLKTALEQDVPTVIDCPVDYRENLMFSQKAGELSCKT